MVALSRKLEVPKMLLVINRVLQNTDFLALLEKISQTYEAPGAGIFPNCDEMMALASSALFYLRFQGHPLSNIFREVANQITA